MQCVAYIRTTNKNLADENLRIQREMIKDFVLKKRWELTCVYSDISSGIDKNKNLKLMIEDVRHGNLILSLLQTHQDFIEILNY
ncbi:recombinase family protein [Calidifontibacillus erzurumensis]|uniref:Recombinase family protein n=1 Tax=Calidifontibacillus erzurumensis TaxID=2741433 RepID=A0A8J8GF41_9BACI|nr:recombinase family protein [Calidifontibacillus erzurumensis]NSL52755.1 recombinase family protein [Calidifontibacillus erzurumensis]